MTYYKNTNKPVEEFTTKLVLSKGQAINTFVMFNNWLLNSQTHSNMKKLLPSITVIILISTGWLLVSCGSDDNDPSPDNSRNITYELTGNYTGKIIVAYTLANGGTQSFSDIRLPWTKEVMYESSVFAIAFSGSGEVSLANVPGQTVNINIYSDGKVVRSGSATVDSNQVLIFPTLSFQFP